ncbi:MAG: hypothetical protein ACRC2M_15090, partial [Planktothrix sp.]
MIKNDSVINTLMYGNIIETLAAHRNISIKEAEEEFSKLNFKDYHELISEAGTNIVPPSGQTITPTTSSTQKSPAAATSPQQAKPSWAGGGAPIEVGMTVGMKGANGVPVPGQVSQVDMSAKGVKVKNPTTGKDEWMNTDSLEPVIANQAVGSTTTPVTEQFKSSYSVGDFVDTPLGSGIIMNVSPDADITGKVSVKLDDPVRAGEDGQYKDTF